ncbi:aminopeptidase [Novymonas esmeraldas]|uniref:Aminopeptidase n=1 Tax=Novymonas esmeraldas TaxID=1808958 RepID=A0AAW0ENP2_9TRYP
MTPPPTHVWHPNACSLQLVFHRPTGGAIRAGTTYQGTSVVRYRRERYTEWSECQTGADAGVNDVSEYAEFMRHRRVVAEKDALHLHALTTAGGIYKDARVLDVQSYHVHCVTGGPSGPLKVLSVEQEDAAGAAAAAAAASGTQSGTAGKGGKGKAKTAKKSGAAAPDANPSTADDAATTAGSGGVDWGSKLVLFEGAGRLPPFSEVELTVQFVGTVQQHDHGGIYAARGSGDGGGEDVPLLTHLEVRFARCAFPCPDDPQYRLDWQLRSIQLPSVFGTILTNGEERGRKELVAQQAVQVSFAPCGPLPAYVFAFACFPDTALDTLEGRVEVWDLTSEVAAEGRGMGASTAIPVRVLARPQARVPPATLERVLHVTLDAVAALQRLFRCPLPLLQCEHLDVLLGPTMPFISGMEHHCSIILNESVYQAGKKSAHGGGGNAEVEQTELIVHELAHHWVGNALGLPFSVKEGICQVVEQCVGDTLLGKPMRRYTADSAAAATAEVEGGAAPSSSVTPAVTRAGKGGGGMHASEKGREFTGTSYQLALNAIKRLVAEQGFDAFARSLSRLLHDHYVSPTVAAEEQGGVPVLRRMGVDVAPPPYLSTEEFLSAMQNP